MGFGGVKQKVSVLRSLVVRELHSRFKGTSLGFLWTILNPIMMLVIYSTVFVLVFKAKWLLPDGNTANYGLMLFVGILCHICLTDVISSAGVIIRSNTNLVKKVIFPVELLPLSCVLVACVNLLIGLALVCVYALFTGAELSLLSIGYMLLAVFVYFFTLAAFAFLLATLGVFLKDVAQITPVLGMVLLFTSTVFFSVETAPEELATFLYLNPISSVADTIRAGFTGQRIMVEHLLVQFGCSLLALMLSYVFFKKMKAVFADLL